MGKQQKWRLIPCSKCNAKIGQNCMGEPGTFGTVCLERRQAAEGVVTKVTLRETEGVA